MNKKPHPFSVKTITVYPPGTFKLEGKLYCPSAWNMRDENNLMMGVQNTRAQCADLIKEWGCKAVWLDELATKPVSTMPEKSPAKIVQDIANPVAIEVLATHIEAMSAGIKKLLAGPLTEDTIVLLIQEAAPSIPNGKGYGARQKPTTREIKVVLRGIELLARTHLKPKKL